ncbi:SRPBCC family protein [Streptomyces sp. NPDC006307]|uniref:SRPBCC family protein n=1 Tax=Streptomyces sp. NPDC006307 TaxID=3156748 RepID=UPI0033B76EC1
MTGSSGPAGLTGEAGNRLIEELRQYLEARAEHAVTTAGERLGEATRQLGNPGGMVGSAVLSKVKGGVKDRVSGLLGLGGKGGRKGETRSKSVVVIEDVDVGVPVRQAYDQWTRFQDFGRFAKGVVNVDRTDDTTSQWQVKVAKANRSWKATVVEQVPDERIVWRSEGGKGTTKGAVTFHPLGDNLTKVLLVLEYFPKGLVEKTGNIWRAQGRRARLDLKLFRKYVTLQDEPAEGWRGEIREGEVTEDRGEDEGPEDREDRGQEGQESRDDRDDRDDREPENEEPYEREKRYDDDAPEDDDARDDETYDEYEEFEDERPRRGAPSRR